MGNYLSEPDKKKHGRKDGRSDLLEYGACGMQGWRQHMEDAHLCITDFNGRSDEALFAVFDGHGGREVAAFSKNRFPHVLLESPLYERGEYLEALRRGYLRLDELLNAECKEKWQSVGCTAVSVFFKGREIFVANAGDSRAVLCRRGIAIDLTEDHKPTNPEENSRINQAGGVVLHGRVNGNLNLSRSIGDLVYKNDPSLSPERQVITANPDTFSRVLDPGHDEFIVIACDGIWEVMDSQSVCDFIKPKLRDSDHQGSISTVVDQLLDVICSKNVCSSSGVGLDNLTCVILDLRPGLPLLADSPDRPRRVDPPVHDDDDDDDEREPDA
jgi:serine/threonine protein phosphatase PrpC